MPRKWVEAWYVQRATWQVPIYDTDDDRLVKQVTVSYIGYGDTSDGQNLWDVFLRVTSPDGVQEYVLGRQGDSKTVLATKLEARMNGGPAGPNKFGIRYCLEAAPN